MAITRWDPFEELHRLQSDLNRLWAEPQMRPFTPAVDIFEEESALVLRAEVPGIKAEDLHVNLDNGVLTLSGERKLENEERREGYHRVERRYGSFQRSFALPKTVDPEGVEANLNAGVLTLRLGKRPAAQSRRITVHARD